jgi:two-component system, chemotaxis family, CheB/CheR fusion protein
VTTARDDMGLSAVIEEMARQGAAGFEWWKDSCLMRRIEIRMRARGAESLFSYAAFLRDDPGEVDRLLHTISVRVTGFFRNPDSWQALQRILEVERIGTRGRIVAWSMGCSTGEEAWTLAMLLSDHAAAAGTPPPEQIHVFASDLDPQAVAHGQAGRYQPAVTVAIREVLPRQHGSIHDGHFEVDPALRPRVSFRREDLTTLNAPTIGSCDLICCRNLLIFLGREGQRRVLDSAFRSLLPGGLLMLGRTESLVAMPEPRLVPVDITHRIYRRAQ